MSQAEAANPETQPRTSTEGSGGNVRKKKRIGGCLFILFLLLLLIAAGIAVAYVMSRNQSDEKFNERIDTLTQSGKALEVGEVIEKNFATPKGTLDTTSEWQATIAMFGSPEYLASIKGIPYVGVNVTPKLPPVQWKELQDCSDFIASYRKELLRLQIGCSGYAILQSDFQQGIQLPDQSIDALNKAWDFLVLSCYVSAHERDGAELVTRLVSCLNFGRCVALHPGHILQRLDFEQRSLDFLMTVLPRIEFDEKALEKFRNATEGMASWQPIQSWWEYQRAIRLLMYNDVEKFRETWLFKKMEQNPKQAAFLKNLDAKMNYSPFSGDDAITFLEHMASVEEMLSGNPVQVATSISEKEEAIWNTVPSGLDRYKKPTARFMVPQVSNLVKATGEVAVARNIFLAAVAVDRYRFIEKQFPSTLSEACDGFLAEVPSDLYTSEPVWMKPDGQQMFIMSLGPNQVDDNLRKDDIGVALNLEKWDASLGDVREAR